jgi:rubrerythrin
VTNATETNAPGAHAQTATRELFCRRCGYGVVVRREPPDCPMCRSSAWSAQAGFAHWN